MRISNFLFASCIIFALGCSNPQGEIEKKHFDFRGLIDEQVDLLSKLNPSLEKNLIINTQKDKSYVEDVNWKNELSLFKSFDINFTKTSSAYIVKEVLEEGQQITSYTIPDSTGIVSLKIFRTANNTLSRIEGMQVDKNSIFKNFKVIGLNFDQNKANETQLIGYCLKGGQKLIAKDSLTFHVDAKVL